MCTIVIEVLTPLDRASCIKMYKNNAQSRLFRRIAKGLFSFQKCRTMFCFHYFECLNGAVSKTCRLELRFQNLPFSKSAGRIVAFSCERDDYPLHFSQFSKCADILRTQSKF